MQDNTDGLSTASKRFHLDIHSVKTKVMNNREIAETGLSLSGYTKAAKTRFWAKVQMSG